MLDTETKRKIDNARDIMVGKVPDPKSQVEQITIALIYKFMDDMDKQSEEWGGKASFFTGEYAKYAWSKIFDPRLGGFELIDLYGNAIVKMNQNPGIPQLFRDIFKNAYLPYRDPETLKSFLKEINQFTYDHSERLGDAFEYLLSVLSSQGDAGQFRTPRHIIDFIVEVVDPTKKETVLDPACGTAGFLISSYRHILKANTEKRNGDKLTATEKKRLLTNFEGYDISPDMVRLSLVNMYLHGFSNPKIHEYDTLTSEQRWNETADVILANPPFMTPKGGIRPHKRFSVQAKRSEVLFVDYIAEHLNPNGRAGVIVPEGIIFQSSNVYKNLRKMLVENYLWAVVSLPAGVFNPYAGVKTSILLMDKALSKKADKILFAKIENDGFDLGAQRRPIDKNDLPKALDFIKDYKRAVIGGTEVEDTDFAHTVEKPKIAESGDWNLSGERYKTSDKIRMSDYKWVELGQLCNYVRGVTYSKKDEVTEGGLVILRANNISLDTNALELVELRRIKKTVKVKEEQKLKQNDIFICAASGSKSHIGKVAFIDKDLDYYFGGFMAVLRTNGNVEPKYLFEILKSKHFKKHIEKNTVGANIRNLKFSIINSFKIPRPPLDIQKAIVSEIDGYQKIIDGARQVINNYKPTIKIDPDWPMESIGKHFDETRLGLVKSKGEQSIEHPHPYIKMDNITEKGELDLSKLVYVRATNSELESTTLDDGDFIYNTRNAPNLVGKCTVYHGENGKYLFNNNILRIKFKKELNPDFANYYLNSKAGKAKIKSLVSGTTSVAAIYQKNFAKITIPIPPLSVQREIVAQIKAEQEIINANKKLIEIYEQKIKDKIVEVWGE
ncbi:MAG TPA: N-6 DNA methylase [Sedimentisphaerales bacterium]|nr:N-6 DNA methylase [Sedimentisphaerales bacterium]